jgi:hypothetical protein
MRMWQRTRVYVVTALSTIAIVVAWVPSHTCKQEQNLAYGHEKRGLSPPGVFTGVWVIWHAQGQHVSHDVSMVQRVWGEESNDAPWVIVSCTRH